LARSSSQVLPVSLPNADLAQSSFQAPEVSSMQLKNTTPYYLLLDILCINTPKPKYPSNPSPKPSPTVYQPPNPSSLPTPPIAWTRSCSTDEPGLSSNIINIVVDTCVLLDNLPEVEQMANNGLQGGVQPLVWIPWTVLQELDNIKDNRKYHENLKYKARAAIKWINSCLIYQTTNSVQGQTVDQEKLSSERFTAQCPDDKILQFCLYLKEKEAGLNNILLLTNDINLSSKALINGIDAVQHQSLHQKLNEMTKKMSM